MRITAGVVLWLVAAAAATTVGLVAVSAIGTDIFGAGAQRPLTQSEVDEQLSRTTTPTPPPSSTAPTTTTTSTTTSVTTSVTPPPGRTTLVRSDGGTVLARCVAGGVEVVSYTPAQGFQAEPDDDDVDDHPKVTFVSGEREIEVRLRCAGDGTITHTIEEND
jgi:hypothetical protein